MRLLDRVRKDSQKIMNSTRYGFSTDIELINPDGLTLPFKAIVAVIHNLIDPDTGVPVSGFLATASINILDLKDQSVEMPEGEMDENERPWLIRESDILGQQVTYKIVSTAPDKANGNIVCDLGAYDY